MDPVDPAEIIFIKETGAEIFYKNLAVPHPVRAL
jgi:hypothetical protein